MSISTLDPRRLGRIGEDLTVGGPTVTPLERLRGTYSGSHRVRLSGTGQDVTCSVLGAEPATGQAVLVLRPVGAAAELYVMGVS